MLDLDFERVFPHKFWISTWARDESYPKGFRYKLLSARHEPGGPIELVILLEEPDGSKTEVKRYDVDREELDQVARTFTEGFTESYSVQFELHDFSSITEPGEFERAAEQAGWHSSTP